MQESDSEPYCIFSSWKSQHISTPPATFLIAFGWSIDNPCVRKELLKRAELPLQQIVPLSVSQSVTCATATMKTQCIAGGAEPEKGGLQGQLLRFQCGGSGGGADE